MLSGSSSTSMSEVTLEANVETPRGLIEPLGSGSGISNGREKVLEEAFLSIGERADDGTLSVEEMMSSGELKASIEVLQRKDKPKAEKVAVLRTLMAAFKDMTDSDIIVEQNVVEILCSEMRRLYTGKMNAEGNEGEVGSQGCSVGDTVPAVKANVNCFEFWATGALFISKTVNLSNEGRNRLLQCRGLDLLACAALRDEMVAVRTQACQAIATMGTWSGPQNAAEVLETPYVVKAIDTVLRDVKHEFSSALKCSMIDAVSVMASRNKARGILQRGGINDAVTVAVKSASNSKDLFFAAKASVAAGALRGKTVDKFGFVVEAKTSSMASEETEEDSPDMSVVLDDTKIQQSQQQQSQYENILRTQNTAHPEAITSPTVDLGNYLSLAKTTAAATRGLSFFGDDKESIAMWSALLENNEVDSLRRQSDGKLLKYLRELARGGIPQSLRWKVWPFLLCIDELKKEHEGLFKKSLEAPLSVATRNDIDKDVTRTMPSHELFWSGGAQVGLKSLRNVLRAYAAAVPEVSFLPRFKQCSSCSLCFWLSFFSVRHAYFSRPLTCFFRRNNALGWLLSRHVIHLCSVSCQCIHRRGCVPYVYGVHGAVPVQGHV